MIFNNFTLNVIACSVGGSEDWGLTEGALQLQLEPVVDALAVELVRALQRLHHRSHLQLVQTDRTVVLLAALRIVLERIVRINDLFDLLW